MAEGSPARKQHSQCAPGQPGRTWKQDGFTGIYSSDCTQPGQVGPLALGGWQDRACLAGCRILCRAASLQVSHSTRLLDHIKSSGRLAPHFPIQLQVFLPFFLSSHSQWLNRLPQPHPSKPALHPLPPRPMRTSTLWLTSASSSNSSLVRSTTLDKSSSLTSLSAKKRKSPLEVEPCLHRLVFILFPPPQASWPSSRFLGAERYCVPDAVLV